MWSPRTGERSAASGSCSRPVRRTRPRCCSPRAPLANGSDLVGRNLMLHNNAHVVAVDLNRRNDVVFQKTLSVNDWYHDRWARSS